MRTISFLHKLFLVGFIFAVPLLLVTPAHNSIARNIGSDEEKAYADFIVGIMKTSQSIRNNKSLCVFGSDEISQIIGERVNNVITVEEDLTSLSKCKATYIAKAMNRAFKIEAERFIREGVLTIAIFDGFSEMGGMIQVQMGRRSFELIVNSKELKASNVKLNGLFHSLIIN